MCSLCVKDVLAALVVVVSLIPSDAFVQVAPASFSQRPPLSCSTMLPVARGAQVTGEGGGLLGLPRYTQWSRRTTLSTLASSIYPDGVPDLPGMKTIVETEEEEEQRAIREWKDDGRKGRVLVRRKEIPSPDRDAPTVCQLVFQSLQNNDDPMLDYGAAVAIKFSSSRNAIHSMTPEEYGSFLRNDPEQVLLIDNASCAPAARVKLSSDGRQALQKVELVGRYPNVVTRIADVQLTKEEDDCWRVDAIALGPAQEE